MTSVSKAEHMVIHVEEIDEALDFYTNVMGLTEIIRENGVVYLGCGLDENYDLGVVEGGTGVEHFAIRVEGLEALESYEQRLRENGVEVSRHDQTEPNQKYGLRFTLPSGVDMELVVVEDRDYWHSTTERVSPSRNGATPLDLDHHNLKTTKVHEDMVFVRDNLDFQVSDIVEDESGKTLLAFTRYGDFHHDIGHTIARDSEETLHHVGWEMDSVEHMKRFIDRMVQAGVDLEVGISRHNVGNNVFAYFWEPGGNRFEISTEMATLNEDTPTDRHVVSGNREANLSAWGGIEIPDSFKEGS